MSHGKNFTHGLSACAQTPFPPTEPTRPHTAHEWKTSPNMLYYNHRPHVQATFWANDIIPMQAARFQPSGHCLPKAQEPPNKIVQHAYPPKQTKNESTRQNTGQNRTTPKCTLSPPPRALTDTECTKPNPTPHRTTGARPTNRPMTQPPPAPGPERRPLSQLTYISHTSTAATTTCRNRTSMQLECLP